MQADFQKNKKNDWRWVYTPFGWVWWNCVTHELEYSFWRGMFKKIFNK